MVKNGVLLKGNYNKSAYDRTTWYAFKVEEEWLYTAKPDVTILANGSDDIVQPIPDSKPQIEKQMETTDKIVFLSDYNIPAELAIEFIAHRKNKKAPITRLAMVGFGDDSDMKFLKKQWVIKNP